MGAAEQVYSRPYDRAFFALPLEVRQRIEARIDEMGLNLARFQHHRLTGSARCRLRAGEYRVIYSFDVAKNEIELLFVGHRREIYRKL
jgi:mRNA-degrading endonuclease RelE of RelBE toxin-antitoxin system